MSTTVRKCAIWARVSTTDQHTENQLAELRQWAADRGLEVAEEFVTEDSAWWDENGTRNGSKGKEFDKAREALLDGAQLGRYSVVLIWALDRISRRGIEDTLATLRHLYERDCDVWSLRQPWLETSDRHMRQILVSMFAWMAEMESSHRGARIRAGLKRRKAEGKPVGGRKAGAKDKRKREHKTGQAAGWSEERKAALAERNRQRTQGS